MSIKKADLQAENDHLRHENTVHMMALQYVMRDAFDATERVSLDGTRYTLRLVGATAAHGGILLSTFSAPGQNDMTTAEYLDEVVRFWSDRFNSDSLPFRIALGRIATARARLNERAA